MTIELPKAEKVYTTVYEDFRGVDFTNDPSNIWYRRTPTGTNILPDESGRPFKRTGWKKEITAQDFAEKYAEDNGETAPSEITIRKCYYFELAGQDHLVVFTNYGVFIYREELISYPVSYDEDLIGSFDRAFFFEGNGKSAFYIYGGYKIWEYSYSEANGFTWQEVEPYIPRVNISVDARHESGTDYEPINMLSDYIAEDFQNNIFATVSSYSTSVTGATLAVNEAHFLAMKSEAGSYVFTYTSDDHSWLLAGDQVQISNYGISLDKTPSDNDTITVVITTALQINLPRRMTGIEGMKVIASVETQFDTELTLQTVETVTTPYYCTLVTPQYGNSHIKFYSQYVPLVEGEDAIRVIYPRNAVETTSHSVSKTITVEA